MKDLEHTLIPMEEKGEIVLYQPDDSVRLEVRLQDEMNEQGAAGVQRWEV